jgi:predicted RNA-binding Zn ribbon-like protein
MTTDSVVALRLAGTIRHDGHGGVADDLTTPGALGEWLAAHPDLPQPPASDETLADVLRVREAVRALFARAVRPAPPSRADAHRLIAVDDAVERLNVAAAAVAVAPRLRWSGDDEPAASLVVAGPPVAASTELTATLARAAIGLLTGPDRERLRACPAPRCVRYFLQGHGRQEFCTTSCSNRARAARHYEKQRNGAATE